MGPILTRFHEPQRSQRNRRNTNNIGRRNSSVPSLPPQEEWNALIANRFIEGRRFHNNSDVTYAVPNDEIEKIRLEKQHILFQKMFQSNYSSPIYQSLKDGIVVLDVGCGPGSWIIDMSVEYPRSTFLGIDISPNFPDEGKPLNCGFLEYNVLDSVPFPEHTFDYVFQRGLALAFNGNKFSTYLNEVIRVCKPGGWVEMMEPCINVINPSPTTKKFVNIFRSALMNSGIDPELINRVPLIMQSSDKFTSIKVCEKPMNFFVDDPITGRDGADYFITSLLGTKVIMKSVAGVGDIEFDDMLNAIKSDTRDPRYHNMCLVYKRVLAQTI